MAEQTLKNHFLVAMPSLIDPNFAGTVVYLVAHDAKHGATGVVVNRETTLALTEIFEKAGIPVAEGVSVPDLACIGGPVEEGRGFVLHEPAGRYGLSEEIAPGICFTQTRDVLEDVAQGKGPAKRLVCLGYAGWTAGQLEGELARNDWLTVPGDASVLFDVPAGMRYAAALQVLGLDPETFLYSASEAGHA